MSNKEYLKLTSKLYKNCPTLEDKFKLFSSYLLKQFKLKVGNAICSLEEIEIYYHSSDHSDEYVHQNKDQLLSGTWYFHQYATGTYKSGTYKGMDITFGNGKDVYGGVLIRSISNQTDNEFITGPCNTVNYLLKKSGCEEVSDLVKKIKSLDVYDDKNPFYLTIQPTQDTGQIFTGPRVGLSTKYPEYLIKEYRYLKHPTKISKNRSTIISSLYNGGMKEQDICTITKVLKASVKKAIKEFDDAEDLTEDEVKALKSDKINKLFGFHSKNLE